VLVKNASQSRLAEQTETHYTFLVSMPNLPVFTGRRRSRSCRNLLPISAPTAAAPGFVRVLTPSVKTFTNHLLHCRSEAQELGADKQHLSVM
jgi:hypothetical protein